MGMSLAHEIVDKFRDNTDSQLYLRHHVCLQCDVCEVTALRCFHETLTN